MNCTHSSYRDIPDGQNSTCEASGLDAIFMDVLNECIDDSSFIKENNNARRTILQRHRAHERANQGRGVASYRTKNVFVKLDEKRGISTKY
jgi:hypothetical protein